MKRLFAEMIAAFQFLTCVPMPGLAGGATDLSRAATFFPVVGLILGLAAGLLDLWLMHHLPATAAALLVVLFTVLITGGLHEDGLADAADAFGGGWSRERVLEILQDSRIGSFGAIAIAFSLLARTLLIASLPPHRVIAYFICAHVLCRWTALPLGCFLPSARNSGQGMRLARQISPVSLIAGSVLALGISAYLLRASLWLPWTAVLLITLLSAMYYRRRIGGITGDCFGATIQLAEIAVYLCGVWQ
ncbi:adenosylcobinamide-GDP ribazoletransferase [Paracidobacterium acidisoli]|uniref:Adenosylcobinamide-GDP ribazoletransferase n=1 Tax=Paracidobacterium acidisoli TaxID=2303751 RepID=A0A372IPX3_9BACT|nr:adenosylcobinamide-GDP ribazoletransferase [Paracidobacterium acidisoli]MBT9331253.1 adenosylcobinamide-GDP ribazoletransferase [Paracidobacterium acidisoli]